MKQPLNVMGSDGWIWFVGVCECLMDPEKLGRIQVRALGDHTQNKDDIPTEDLPWAMPMMPITSASMSGIGQAPVGLVQGSWVIGFYRDGTEKQQPIIIGSIGGLPLDPANGEVGFNDPIECFPQEDKLEEPDTNRHARGVVGKHVVEPIPVTMRKAAVLTNIASSVSTWDEPITPYEPIYPYNQVWEGPYNSTCDSCEWGHIEEWDSTPGSERYFRQHKTSQNFIEIHPDGKEVRKIYGDNFELDLASKHLYVSGDYKVTIDGNKEESILGDYNVVIEGDYIQHVLGDKRVEVVGNNTKTTWQNTITRSYNKIYEICLDDIIRKSNKEIWDLAGITYSAIAVDEITTGIGVVIPSIMIPDVPDIEVSDSFKSVALSCAAENSSKSSQAHVQYPVTLPIIHWDETVATVQLKIVKEDKIYLDSKEVHDLGTTFFAENTHHQKDAFLALDLNVIGNVYVGGDVDVGNELHALEPMLIDPLGDHPYLVPTAGSSPIAPSNPEIPEKTVMFELVDILADITSPTEIAPTPIVPGEIYKCK